MTLEALYLRAWIDGLHRRADAPPVRPVEPLPAVIPLGSTRHVRVLRRG